MLEQLEKALEGTRLGAVDELLLPQTAEAETGPSEIDTGALGDEFGESLLGARRARGPLRFQESVSAVPGAHDRYLVAPSQRRLGHTEKSVNILAPVGRGP